MSTPKARVVIFVPLSVAERCQALATRHKASKSEVYRLAIEAGLKSVRPALQRLARNRPESFQPSRGGGTGRAAPSSAPTSAGAVGEDVHAQVLAYGQRLVSVSPGTEREDARVVLEAQARVLGVPADDVDQTVDEVLGELFAGTGPAPPDPADAGTALPPD